MVEATIVPAIAGFLVVIVSGGSLAFIIHRNGKDKAHLSGMYEQKVIDLKSDFDEFKDEVKEFKGEVKEFKDEVKGFRDEIKKGMIELHKEIKYCRTKLDGGGAD